jgi:hypothetical protein
MQQYFTELQKQFFSISSENYRTYVHLRLLFVSSNLSQTQQLTKTWIHSFLKWQFEKSEITILRYTKSFVEFFWGWFKLSEHKLKEKKKKHFVNKNRKEWQSNKRRRKKLLHSTLIKSKTPNFKTFVALNLSFCYISVFCR